jgi:hypothetical protein
VSAAETYKFNNADLREAERLMWDYVLGKELTVEEHQFAMFGKRAKEMMAQNGGKRVSIAEVQRDLALDDWVLVVRATPEAAVREAQSYRLKLKPILESKPEFTLCVVEQGLYPHVVAATVYAWSHSGGSCAGAERVRDAIRRTPEMAEAIELARKSKR